VRRRIAAAWFAFAFVMGALHRVDAQDQQAARTDSDPTRPILFSVRSEFYRVTDDGWRMLTIARYDQAMFRNRPWLGGRRGMLIRLELPAAAGQAPGVATAGGLGDAYAQLLLIPRLTGRFAFAAGGGLFIPTATNKVLGTGKWTAAPAAIPVWFTRGVGMVYVKFQNVTSFAGDAARPDANVLLVTPTVIRTLGRTSWVLIDSETKTDWRRGGRTGVKSGVQFGHIMARRLGFWVKPELWWGPNQDGRWNLKTGFILYR
jgi:hypothetical protein